MQKIRLFKGRCVRPGRMQVMGKDNKWSVVYQFIEKMAAYLCGNDRFVKIMQAENIERLEFGMSAEIIGDSFFERINIFNLFNITCSLPLHRNGKMQVRIHESGSNTVATGINDPCCRTCHFFNLIR